MKVVVLGGGKSTEREVSLRSAKSVSTALTSAGYKVENLDPIDIRVLDSIKPGSIVFPILHGNNGEDGFIQQEMDKRGLCYLGSTSKTSEECFDKGLVRACFETANIPVAPGGTITESQYTNHPLSSVPHVLKVSRGGSSIGTYIVNNPLKTDNSKIKEVFTLDEIAVIEVFIQGTEITVPILDNKALPVIEIKPPKNEEFDYRNKYNGKTKEICPPVSVNLKVQELAQKYAEEAHALMGCRHLSRVDFIVKPNGDMVALEINTMPGMTNQSLYPIGALAAGLSFPQLMTKFVQMVQRDYAV